MTTSPPDYLFPFDEEVSACPSSRWAMIDDLVDLVVFSVLSDALSHRTSDFPPRRKVVIIFTVLTIVVGDDVYIFLS